MMDQAGAFACKWLFSRLELVCYNLVNGLKKKYPCSLGLKHET